MNRFEKIEKMLYEIYKKQKILINIKENKTGESLTDSMLEYKKINKEIGKIFDDIIELLKINAKSAGTRDSMPSCHRKKVMSWLMHHCPHVVGKRRDRGRHVLVIRLHVNGNNIIQRRHGCDGQRCRALQSIDDCHDAEENHHDANDEHEW